MRIENLILNDTIDIDIIDEKEIDEDNESGSLFSGSYKYFRKFLINDFKGRLIEKIEYLGHWMRITLV